MVPSKYVAVTAFSRSFVSRQAARGIAGNGREYLPSSRAIAGDFNVSRTTVLNPFDALSAEGYFQGRMGSGTTVASYIPGELAIERRHPPSTRSEAASRIARRARLDPFEDLSFLRPLPVRYGQHNPNLLCSREKSGPGLPRSTGAEPIATTNTSPPSATGHCGKQFLTMSDDYAAFAASRPWF